MTNVVPLSEVLEIQNGFAFDSELFNDNASGTPIIRIRDLARGFTETYYNGDFDDKYLVKKDDFLIGMDGEFRCYQWKSEDALLNQRVCRLQNFSKKVNPKYIFYLINKYLIEIENNTAFVTVKHLSSKQINSIQIPLPPLPEQERIVRLLDEAEQVRKLRVQASTRMEDFVPALFREMFGNPAELEKMNWKFFPVGEFSDVSYGLADKLDANTPPESGTRIITISNVTLDGQINLSVERYSLADTSKREKARLKQGDLLFNWRNGSEIHVGKTALWEEQVSGEVLHVSFLLKIRPVKEKADSSYLWALLNRSNLK